MKQVLVSGSSAQDIHMHYSGVISDDFSIHQDAEKKEISKTSSVYENYHGGTGANIAYNLGLLGENPILLSSIGEDYEFSGLIKEKINIKYVHRERDIPTAKSINISDDSGNKMTLFYPGAMNYASQSKIEFVEENIGVAIVSANDIPTMLEHARKLSEKNIPVLLDPAQQITQMDSSQLREFLSFGNMLIVNHYEFADIQKISGYTEYELESMFETLIITYNASGSQIFSEGNNYHIQAKRIEDAEDTTGAGDAYRAGVLYGIIEGWEIKTACQLGTLLASYSLYTPGSQNHHVSLSVLQEDMKDFFGVEVDLYTKRKY